MKKEIINRIKSLFKEYEKDEFSFFYGRSFTITYDYSTYDVLSVVDAEDEGIIVDCVCRNNFGLNNLNLEELSTKTLNKILNKIEQSIKADYFEY